MPRRMLLVIPWLALGGVNTFNLNMIRELAPRGWSFDVVTTLVHDHPWRPMFEHLVDSITDVALPDAATRVQRLLDTVERTQPDVIFVSDSRLGWAIAPLISKQFPTIPIVDYLHVIGPGSHVPASLSVGFALDRTFVTSESLCRQLVAWGADRDRVKVCTINVDPSIWERSSEARARVRTRLGIPESAVVVLFTGRLSAQKHPVRLAAVIEQVLQRLPGAHVVVAGDGEYTPFIDARFRHSPVAGRVHRTGSVSNDEVKDLLSASDIFLLPSRYEGISMGIFEAMAMGVVPVSCATQGQEELVTPEVGVLVPTRDATVSTYAEAVVSIAISPERRARMQAAARQRILDEFTLGRMGDDLVGQLEDVIVEHASRPSGAAAIRSVEAAADTTRLPTKGAEAAALVRAVGVAEEDLAWQSAARHRSRAHLHSFAARILPALYWRAVRIADRRTTRQHERVPGALDGGRPPGPKRPILSTIGAQEGEGWLGLMDFSTHERPGSVADLTQMWRESRGREALVLRGSVGLPDHYRDLVFAMLLKARRRRPRVLITDATWDVGSARLAKKLPWMASMLPRVAKLAIAALDGAHVRYAVLADEEREIFARTWGVPAERVVFTPFPMTLYDDWDRPTRDEGFLFAGGNSHRDYDLLMGALEGTGIRAVLATSWVPRRPLHNVTVSATTHEEFVDLMSRCRAMVVPLCPSTRSAGQQTYLNGMALGKPVVVTRSLGVTDYIEDGLTGIVVDPHVASMRSALIAVMDARNLHRHEVMGERARARVLGAYTIIHYEATLLRALGYLVTPVLRDRTTEPSV